LNLINSPIAEGKLERDIFRKRCNLSLVKCESPSIPVLDSVVEGLNNELSPLPTNHLVLHNFGFIPLYVHNRLAERIEVYNWSSRLRFDSMPG